MGLPGGHRAPSLPREFSTKVVMRSPPGTIALLQICGRCGPLGAAAHPAPVGGAAEGEAACSWPRFRPGVPAGMRPQMHRKPSADVAADLEAEYEDGSKRPRPCRQSVRPQRWWEHSRVFLQGFQEFAGVP
jgi:hypothetical protein